MPEIDPQFDPRLTAALRRLSIASRQSAPAEIGAGLLSEFRRHHTRRRKIRRAGVAAVVASLALAVGLVALRKPSKIQPGSGTPSEVAGTPAKAKEQVTQSSPATVAVSAQRPSARRAQARKNGPRTVAASAANREFLALPGYDPAVPFDQLHVVRVQLPASALWTMGAPVSPDADARRITADFVVSQDGTPYAVRLVQ